jgi:large subunit ribosomal protein L25
MAETYSLDVQNRTIKGKQVRQLRRDNLIPAVVYGAGGEPVILSCPRRPLEILLAKAGGTHVVALNIEGHTTENALVREVVRDPIRRDIQHVDFLRVDLNKKLRTIVPIRFVGSPKLGADLTIAEQLEVECLPKDIPDHFEVNVGALTGAGASVSVKDLAIPEAVHFFADPNDVIVRLELTNVKDDEADAGATPEPELSKTKGKKEEDAEK